MIRAASGDDVKQIKSLIDYWSGKGAMLSRSTDDITENFPEFLVWENDNRVLGIICLDVNGKTATIRTLCVSPNHKGQGIGTALVNATLNEAKVKGVETVYAVTNNIGFFNKFGFSKNKTILSDGQEKAYMTIGISRLAAMNSSSMALAASSENCSKGCLQK